MDHGFDPEGAPTGADEERRYFKNPQKEKKKVEKRGRVYEGTYPDVVPSDEATMMKDVVYAAHTTYDRDNPEIKKGFTFVDKYAFILVVKQYATRCGKEDNVQLKDSMAHGRTTSKCCRVSKQS
jgi:hypothetical protein